MTDRWVLHVDLPFACFGLVIDEELRVVAAPPIARYALGWSAGRAKRYFQGRGATTQITTLKSQGCSSAES